MNTNKQIQKPLIVISQLLFENAPFPGLKLDRNCNIPGELYAGSLEGQPLSYVL